MLKSIKKSFKYLMIFVGIILLVPTFFSLIFRIPEVQTYIIRRIAGHYSEQIKSTITVGRVEYTFFNRLLLHDVLIKDQNNDTLIYSKELNAGITGLSLSKKTVKLRNITLTESLISLVTDTTGLMNLKWYLNLISKSKNKEDKSPASFSVRQIIFKNGRFNLINRNSPPSQKIMDFNNLYLTDINGSIEDMTVVNDTIDFKIDGFGFKGSKGFLVRSMNSSINLTGNDMIFRDIFLYLNTSILNADRIILDADSSGSYKRFSNEVRLEVVLQNSLIGTSDLKFFIPAFSGLNEMIEVSGKLTGTLSELKGRNIRAFYRDSSYLDCDFDFSGLPDFDDTFIHIGVNSIRTSAKDLEQIQLTDKSPLKIPEVVYKLGLITFSGSFTGFATDFVTYGKIATKLGRLDTDISLRPEGKNQFRINGLIKGNGVDIGQLTGNTNGLGKMTMETSINGLASSAEKASGNVTGKIDSIDINGYIYRNVDLKGIFTEKTWDGSIKITDQNIKMDLLGMFDFRNELPEFDFTLNLAESDLHRLNFDKSDSTSQLAMLATANFRGNNIDNLYGEIRLINSTLTKFGNSLELYDFSLKAFTQDSLPAISLKTDFMDANLKGYYEFDALKSDIRRALSLLMPSKYKATVLANRKSNNNFTFEINFKNTDKLNKFFRTGILLSDRSTVNGAFYQDSLIKLDAHAGSFSYRNSIFRDLDFNTVWSDTILTSSLNSSSLKLLGQTDLKEFKATINTIPDSYIFKFSWDNKEKILNKGSFTANGVFAHNTNDTGSPVMIINIDSSNVYNKNKLWKIRPSIISIDSNIIQIKRFVVSSMNNSYVADGTISEKSSDTLRLLFRGIELAPLGNNPNETNSKEDRIKFNPEGTINGSVFISGALKNTLIESDIRVDNFSVLGGDYGDISIISSWNSERKVADINVTNNLYGKRNLNIEGFYDPADRNINLAATAVNLPVDALNPLLDFFASDITGTVSGKVKLTGSPGNLILRGGLMAENTFMKINYLQTKYRINDTIRFDRSGIRFRNIRVADENGNYAVLNGSVFHRSFRDFNVDLRISMEQNEYKVLNTRQNDNELFYGTAYATGVTTIRSNANSLSFDISAKTGKGTNFFIPLNSGLSVSEYSFVSFLTGDTLKGKAGLIDATVSKPTESAIELNFDLEVTPDAEVQLLIDPKAGDVIKGRGEGKLNISLNRNSEFKIYGDYTIEEGDYLFTLQNILNKRFDVENGGKLTFNGDVENADIDLTADYKNLKTSLYPILYPILQDEKYNTRISVEPQLILSGKLFNPVVGFNIYLPNADEETRTYFRNAISTEEELSKQFLYLLVMNSFYSDPSYHSSFGSTAGGTSAMAVTTTEMLTNQLSNWLSQISNDFDVGFHYTPGNKDINSQELQVALSTQLLNDRVTINGNFDVRGENNPGGAPLTGDFDIEYKITEKIRFKVFNRYNSPYTGRGVPYTQGLGIFYKQDFNKFSDLLRKKGNSDIKKEDEITIEE